MVRNVYLEGELGEVFTPHLQIDCNTADVFKCLDANFPISESILIKSMKKELFCT